jgi:hypothetical protein
MCRRTFANDATEKEVLFTQKAGQYVRLRALSEVNGNPWTHAAEINVLGIISGNPVNGVIDTYGNVTINVEVGEFYGDRNCLTPLTSYGHLEAG